MNIFMTKSANRNNIENILIIISLVVVIMLCLLIALRTLQGIDIRQFACLNSVCNSPVCFSKIWAFLFNSINIFKILLFAYCAITIFLHVLFAVFCSVLFSAMKSVTYFAISLKAIFSMFAFVKFRKRLSFLADTTSFCYDLLRHGCFLNKQLCLEPVAAQTAVGSFYYKVSI